MQTNIVARESALKVRFHNQVVALASSANQTPGDLHLSGSYVNGITSPEVMPLVLTRIDWGPLNGLKRGRSPYYGLLGRSRVHPNPNPFYKRLGFCHYIAPLFETSFRDPSTLGLAVMNIRI